MIGWCQTHLTPRAPQFQFVHHDVQDGHFDPGKLKPRFAPFPALDGEFTLVNAISSLLTSPKTKRILYLQEAARVLSDDGVVHASFFLLDKRMFPLCNLTPTRFT